ncbi:integrase [Synechococcus phage Yong-M3-232]|nr:integrase [Synechococcus phage Yong-M3-232]
MTVYKPKKSPYFHFDFQFRGVRHHGSTGCSSKREAEAYERRYRHDLANPVASLLPITIDEAAGIYAEGAQNDASWKTTQYILAALTKGLRRQTQLAAVTQRDLQMHFAKRRAGRSSASVNREIDVARAVWRTAERAKYAVGEMPDWKALYLRVPAAPPAELTIEQEDKVFAAIPEDARDVVRFALISGWRRAEVIGLRWSDVDLAQAEARTKIKGGDIVVRPLNGALVALIANQPRVGPFVFTYVCRKARRGVGKKPGRRKGERYPFTATALRTRWDEARAAAKLEGFRFHDLRHTAATRILRATQNLATTAKVLSHRNLKTTLRYAHVLDDDVRRAQDAAMSRTIPEPPKSRKAKS